MPEWNPDQYLKFASERTQPSIDLATRINVEKPKSIIDIGCGPGNSTQVLRQRWPSAKISGLDSSADMIRKAKEDYPDLEWITADALTFTFGKKYGIVFSNAAIHWIPDHEKLLPRLYDIVNRGGVLAIQVPANNGSPLHQALLAVSSSHEWSRFTSGTEKSITYNTPEFYYDILSSISGKFDIWQTVYYHILNSHIDLVEWYKGSGMRPFLEKLPDEPSRKKFEAEVLARCEREYRVQRNGRVIYPFKRTFFVAYK